MAKWIRTVQFYFGRIREGRLREMWRQTLWIYGYAKQYWLVMLAYTALGFASSGMAIWTGMVTRDLVDIITGHKEDALAVAFGTMAALAVGSMIISQLSGFFSSWISLKVNQEIQSVFFQRLLVTDWESLTEYHTGDLLSRWTSDTAVISGGILNWVPDLLIFSSRFVAIFVVLSCQDLTFALLALASIPVSVLLSKPLLARLQANNKKSAAMGARLSGFHQESFANIQTIKAFDMVRLYGEKLKNLQKELMDMRLDFARMSVWTTLLLGVSGLLVYYLSYGWGIYRVWSGAISYGTMTMLIGLSGTLSGSLHSLASLAPSAVTITTSAGRLMDVLEMPQEDYSALGEAGDFLAAHRAEGISLRMEAVDYQYKNGAQVFRGAGIEAHPYEIIGLVGASGEGKTTLLRLLLALLHPRTGRIWLEAGGESLEMTPAARQFFAYVPQGNTMLSGSIAENMRNVKPDATDEEIEEALRLACAWDFVSRLEFGIHSLIKERGGGFSEGQAQRLAIARALLRKAPILLLDEASSALDVSTERMVLKNIMRHTYPRICLLTTHRPSALELCHRVYAVGDQGCRLLDKGEIGRLIEEF